MGKLSGRVKISLEGGPVSLAGIISALKSSKLNSLIKTVGNSDIISGEIRIINEDERAWNERYLVSFLDGRDVCSHPSESILNERPVPCFQPGPAFFDFHGADFLDAVKKIDEKLTDGGGDYLSRVIVKCDEVTLHN